MDGVSEGLNLDGPDNQVFELEEEGIQLREHDSMGSFQVDRSDILDILDKEEALSPLFEGCIGFQFGFCLDSQATRQFGEVDNKVVAKLHINILFRRVHDFFALDTLNLPFQFSVALAKDSYIAE